MKKKILSFVGFLLIINLASILIAAENNAYYQAHEKINIYLFSENKEIDFKKKIENNLKIYGLNNLEYINPQELTYKQYLKDVETEKGEFENDKYFLAFTLQQEPSGLYTFNFLVHNKKLPKAEIVSYSGDLAELDVVLNVFSNSVVKNLKNKEAIFSDNILYLTKIRGVTSVNMQGFREENAEILYKGDMVKQPYQIAFSPLGKTAWVIKDSQKSGKYKYSLVLNGEVIDESNFIYLTPSFTNTEDLVAAYSGENNTTLYNFSKPEKTKLTNNNDDNLIEISASFAENGKMVFVKATEGVEPKLYIKNSASEKEKPLVNLKGLQTDPSITNDGTLISFVHNEKEIYIVKDDGSKAEKFVSNGASNRAPSFSKDGQIILFSSDKKGRYQIFAKFINKIENEEFLVFESSLEAQTQAVFGQQKSARYKNVINKLKINK